MSSLYKVEMITLFGMSHLRARSRYVRDCRPESIVYESSAVVLYPQMAVTDPPEIGSRHWQLQSSFQLLGRRGIDDNSSSEIWLGGRPIVNQKCRHLNVGRLTGY